MTLRREVLLLVGLVAAVDLVAMLLYFFAGFRHATGSARLIFTGCWTVATLLVVLIGLTRIRAVRGRRARR